MAGPARTKRWPRNLSLLAASIVIAVIGVELLVRMTGRDAPLVWQPEPRFGWWHIPGASVHWTTEGDGWVAINTLGMRDVERTVAKPAGVFRIAVFGDSFTEGVQVNLDQTFTQRLETQLRERGARVEVLNFGVNGYSPLEAFLLFKYVGRMFAPDLVLHAVFTDNDVADCDPELASGQVGAPFVKRDSGTELTVDYSLAEASFRDYHREPLYTLRRWSATYRMLSAGRQRREGARKFQAGLAAAGGIPKRHLVYLDPSPPQWDAAWTTLEKILVAFAAEARSRGSRFAVISVPAGQVVDERVWNQELSRYLEMASKQWRLRGPDERLRGIAVKHGLPFIEVLDDFRKQVSGPPMFFGGMGHMTPRGHEVMAHVLERSLEASGFLKPRSSS